MKVLFSNPPWWIDNPDGIHMPRLLAGVRAGSRWPFTTAVRSRPGHFHFGDYLPYPFFMGSAATYLAATTDVRVAFRDSIALREGYPAFFNYLEQQRFDIIFIESASTSWDHDAGLIAKIKARHPKCKIVVTGPIAALGETLLANHPLHAVIQGEYEKGSVKVVSGATGLLPHDLLTEAELDAAPGPYFDDLHAHRYWDGNPKGQIAPQLQVLSSRGCPFKCIFCVWPAVMTNNDPDGTGKRLVRQYSAGHMEALLTDLIGRYGYRSVYFDDDTFNLGDRHVAALCEVMRRIGLPWSAMCRADTISWDTWALMRESGCFGVKIGFESGNQWVIDNIVRKNLDLDKARDVVVHLKELGFTVHGTFTLGLPGETPEQMAETQRYRRSLPLDSYQESGTAEIEGSPLATLRKTGSLKRYAGAKLDGYHGEADGTHKLQRVALGAASFDDAVASRARGEAPLAEAICRTLLETGGEQPHVLNLLGVLAAENRMLDLGARFFVRALRADAGFLPAALGLGNLLRDEGLAEEAAACFRQMLTIDPECKEAALGLELLKAALAPGTAKVPGQQVSVRAALAGLADTPWSAVAVATDASPSTKAQESLPADTERIAGTMPDPRPRLIVLDHGMRFIPGHHLAYNLGLLTECIQRGLPIQFYVNATCKPEVVSALKAQAVLQPSQYVSQSDDGHCAYLEDFLVASKIAEFNLYKNLKGKVGPEDIIYVHTATPKIVMGIAAWYATLAKEQRPHLCLKFQNHGYRYVVAHYRALVESVFRMALKPFIGVDKVHLAASNKLIADQIEEVGDKPCPVFPIPLRLAGPDPEPLEREPGAVYIGFAGEGREEQGVELLPDVIEAILPAYPQARFVIQLGCPFTTSATLARLHAFGPRVEVLEKCFVGDQFHWLLRRFDALLLPYLPSQYIERSSQIVIEAIALGVPLIVPDGTSMSHEADNFGCGHVRIREYTAPAIAEAIKSFLDNHEALAEKSRLAADVCSRFHRGATLVDMLLATCGVATAVEGPPA